MKKTFTIVILFLLPFFTILAQENASPKKLTHWLSPEEATHRSEFGKNFIETPPPEAPVRNVAEFDKMQGALVRYPFGLPLSLIEEMAKDIEVTTIVASTAQQNTVLQQYITNGVDTSHCNFLIAPSDSYWTRDYGPWFASDSANHVCVVDFPYNRPRPNDDEIPKLVAGMLGIPWYGMNVITTGGNYMTDGMGISTSTTLVWDENPTQTHVQIAQKLQSYLGINNYLVEPDPNNTYIDHIDCWGKYLAPDKILIRKVPTTHPQYAAIEATAATYAATPCSYGYNYRVFRVNTPDDQPYSNSVILNNKVLVPIMGSPWDDSALVAYQNAMPGYQVLGFTGASATPWESTDALHCRVMGLADIGMLYIRHIPLTGNQPAQDNFKLDADLIPCSDSAIYKDSVLIWYKVNSGIYHTARMAQTTGFHYTGYIPKQPAGSIIKYYLSAADKSGRHSTCPLIGPGDPFTFTSVYTDLTAIPDTLRFETYNDCMNGKYTAIRNFTSASINLSTLEEFGCFHPGPTCWMVDNHPVNSFPAAVSPGDSVRCHVIILIPTSMTFQGYWLDTLDYSSAIGGHGVILLLNDTLVFGGIRDHPGLAGPARLAVYPNPGSQMTSLSFRLVAPDAVRLDILDLTGNLISTLANRNFDAGIQTVEWNLNSDSGNKVKSGIYLCRLTTRGTTLVERIVVY
jgi:agmatine/peptidylarginine deiminase